jgi:hypothetical protein
MQTRLRFLLWISVCSLTASAAWAGPFADAVADFRPGRNGGFGADLLPGIVLGPPRGGGLLQGSFDVVALGIGGSITLRFDPPMICDGPGADFTVFENVFHSGSASGPLFTEYAFVAVSQDGITFFEFPYDAQTHVGLAGQRPVLSHPDNGIDPLDPAVSGGDPFDLAAVGLAWARYVRITDVAGAIADLGDLPQFSVAPNAGFDLDAVAALHACDPAAMVSPTPTPPTQVTATATPGANETPTTPPTPTATPTASATATATLPSVFGDLDGDGIVTNADALALIAAIFERQRSAVSSDMDLNGDEHISVADLVRLMEEMLP